MASREQLLDLVTRIQNGDFDDEELTAVQIVDKALAHRPIEL